MSKKIKIALLTSLCFGVAGAHAALFSRNSGTLVYDNVLNITILADWNYSKTTGYDDNGSMPWGTPMDTAGENTVNGWIRQLNTGSGLYGFTDWRLPKTDTNCYAYGCIGSEMGELFYKELGGGAGRAIAFGINTANLKLFTNMGGNLYWTGSQDTDFTDFAWMFHTLGGDQFYYKKDYPAYAIAVRDGDVLSGAVVVVPEPQSAVTLLLGLLTLSIPLLRKSIARAKTTRPGFRWMR